MKTVARSIAATLLSMLFATLALAADVDGTWNASVESGHGAVALQFTFRSDGERVTGTVSAAAMGGMDITDGRLDDNRLTFNLPWGGAPGEPPIFTIAYEAVIDGDEMAVVSTFAVGPGGELMVTEFTARRAR
jgi:hypothetical protein